ncbi:MAG TPA: NAD(P)(+) transhydrogenase (Re/Si-specific) subunit beta [Alphaproteobacteria bacterium]|nr:NAD(P)(+) transhydrogenase (Re/Si-specific) subunit beta [Alphaproteobacteria bacterium]
MIDPPTGFIQLAYVVAASLFIVGLRGLTSPATARRGNLLAALGMLVAVTATLWDRAVVNYPMILTAMAAGAGVGTIVARRVKMTAMPQMVGLLNGLGGGASMLVAVGEGWRLMALTSLIPIGTLLGGLIGLLIGAVTFSGSLIAFGKLQGLITGAPVTFPLQQPLNALLFVAFLAGAGFLIHGPLDAAIGLALVGIALLLGILLVLPIGGADMPVVISLLNSFSGLAASAVGFVFTNHALIIAGALVGASGVILTRIMCRAMNRSLANVLFSGFGTGDKLTGAAIPARADLRVRAIDAEEGAMILAYARSVIIVPGYGMAAAQAQHVVRELAEQLSKRGINVKYAIHPVAGRMPGHMNVLLAEAGVPYSELYDMEAINPQFEKTDVALVVGANDIVNPAARHDPASPIFGMPILDVDKARTVMVIKRSLNPGFAGIDNELFYDDKTLMLFGHAREVLTALVNEVKQLP